MYTSIALLSLANFLVAPSPERVEWHSDYRVALERGKLTQRPLAVFVGAGRTGYDQLSRTGKLTPDVQKLLTDSYVCVYLDTNREPARKLAEVFEVTKGTGLILSDRSGRIQAYHHDGDLASDDLSQQLQYYADPEIVVRTTASNAATPVSPTPPPQPAVRPANC